MLGSPIDHSLSPRMHRAAYTALGLTDWRYEEFAVGGDREPDLATFLSGLGPEWIGFSVTMPLKEAALDVATEVSEHARDVGAANTLLRRGEGWYATSTDATGLRVALAEAGLTGARRALVLGSGATARSAVAAVRDLGATAVTFAVRDRVRAETLAYAERLGLTADVVRLTDARDLVGTLLAADVTISTLPTGTRLGLPALAPDALIGRVVMDVVYGGWPTSLADWAGAAGARVLSGVPMLLHQAAEQVGLMTGDAPPLDAMRRSVADVPGA